MIHFVLTRFNAQAPSFPDGAGLEPDWLTHRFELFERFCFPSMQAQRTPATWLVFFDARTPDECLARACTYHERLPSMEVVIVEGVLTDTRIARFVDGRLPTANVRLCTTRLDNDDAVASDYVARVRAAAETIDVPRFINFPLGYQWQSGGLYHWIDLANPFVSFAETVTPGVLPQTVMCDVRHRDVGTLAPVKQVIAPPTWIQVLHGNNIANALRGVRRLSTRAPRQFASQLAVADRDNLAARGQEFLLSLSRVGMLAARRASTRARGRRS